MARRGKTTTGVAALAAATAFAPLGGTAHARSCSVVPFNTAVAGSVHEKCDWETYTISASCQYARQGASVVYSGSAQSSSAQRVAQVVYVRCSVSAGGQSSEAEQATPGPSSQVASSATLPAGQVTVCVEAFAIFGPGPVIVMVAPEACA